MDDVTKPAASNEKDAIRSRKGSTRFEKADNVTTLYEETCFESLATGLRRDKLLCRATEKAFFNVAFLPRFCLPTISAPSENN